ncbi:hypothetical protein HPB49_026468 [Dermacentor silvarum]|nr:hypothetical protein HPB49_026468 [Dermacentor silvarum]
MRGRSAACQYSGLTTRSSLHLVYGLRIRFWLQQLSTMKNPRSGENFDPAFTQAKLCLSPGDPLVMRSLTGNEFQGFTFVNSRFCGVCSF